MSFPRARLTRFNEKQTSITPAPNTYQPKLPRSSSAQVLQFGNVNNGGTTTRPATRTLSTEDFYNTKNRMLMDNLRKKLQEEMAPLSPAEKLKAVRQSFYQCQQKSSQQIQILEEEREELLEKISALQEENKDLNARVATLEETITGLKADLKTTEVVCNEEINRLKEHSGMNRQEMEALKATISGLTDTVHILVAENEMLKGKTPPF